MKFWTLREVAQLRALAHRPRHVIAARLGRTQRAVVEQARRQRIARTAAPTGRWPACTVRRARQLRAQGVSLTRIAAATGVPRGTLRHWFYSGVRA